MSQEAHVMTYGKINGEFASFKVYTSNVLEAIRSVREEWDFDGAVMVVVK
jgi:hypothetical protein